MRGNSKRLLINLLAFVATMCLLMSTTTIVAFAATEISKISVKTEKNDWEQENLENPKVESGSSGRYTILADSIVWNKNVSECKPGDTVKVTSTGKMYFVVDDTKLDEEAGYEIYTAGSATSVPWSGVTGKPSTFTPSTHTHTTAQVTGLDSALAGKATSAQGAKADTAVQSVKISGNPTELKNGTSVTLPAYPTTLPASDVQAWAKAASKPTYTKSEVGLGNVTNDKQVKGLASGTTAGHVVTWGADGYTVADSGFTIGVSVPANAKFTDTTYGVAGSSLGLVKTASGTNKVAVAGDGTMSVSAISTDILSQGSNTLILNGGGAA